MKRLATLCTLAAASLLVACTPPIKPSPDKSLVVANCPKLAEIKPDSDGGISMGRLLQEFVYVAGQYNECRAAALGVDKQNK